MSTAAAFVAGFCTPFALAAALLVGLAARYAWERRRVGRRQRPPKSLLERLAGPVTALEDEIEAELQWILEEDAIS